MSGNILLIRKDETFLVNTIKKNMQQNRFGFIETGLSVKDISAYKDEISVMMLYADDMIGEARDALVYIKDLCIEENKILLVIGGRNEFDIIEKIIPKELIEVEVERPLDIAALMEKIGGMIDEKQREQRKKMVLIVDDDPMYLKMVKEWLKDDYRVGMANSGMQAITWLAVNKADLVLLDYEMPTINGSKVLEMLRSEAHSSSIPVMFLTGKSDKESIMEVLALKPAGYLLKTIEKKALLDTLGRFFMEQKYGK